MNTAICNAVIVTFDVGIPARSQRTTREWMFSTIELEELRGRRLLAECAANKAPFRIFRASFSFEDRTCRRPKLHRPGRVLSQIFKKNDTSRI